METITGEVIMDEEYLFLILKNHRLWLNCSPGGVRAELNGVTIRNIDLSGINFNFVTFTNVKFWGVKMDETTFNNATLMGVSFINCNLSRSSFVNTELHKTNFTYSSLNDANLSCSRWFSCNLWNVSCVKSIWDVSNVFYTEFRECAFTGCSANGANWLNMFFTNVKDAPNTMPMVCPETGSFIGWKQAQYGENYYTVKLEIPEDALRSSGTSRKCRCSKAKVLAIQNFDGTDADVPCVYSKYCENFKYEVGKVVEEPNFTKDRWIDCASGIHFFMTRQEAIDYGFGLWSRGN